MSFEQTAYISRANIPERDSLQAAIDSLGFDCKVDAFYQPFKSSGFHPCLLNGTESGVEIYFEAAAELMQDFPDLEQSIGNRDVAINFRWGGDLNECACGLILSAALAKEFGAIVHYQDDDMLYSAEQLVEEVRSILE